MGQPKIAPETGVSGFLLRFGPQVRVLTKFRWGGGAGGGGGSYNRVWVLPTIIMPEIVIDPPTPARFYAGFFRDGSSPPTTKCFA